MYRNQWSVVTLTKVRPARYELIIQQILINFGDMKSSYRNFFITISVTFTLFFLSCSDDHTEVSNQVSRSSITVAEAIYRDLSQKFTVSAEVESYRRIYVASRIAGLVEDVRFEEGNRVRKGDIMARIDTRQQQVELRRALVAFEEARDAFERAEQLFESDAISHAEYLTIKRNLELAENDVDLLKLHVEFGEIRAPVDAVVTARLVEIGNNISVNERMFTIAELGMLVIRPGVSEMNLMGLTEGMSVNVTLDVYPDQIFTGRIRRIFPRADPITRLFTVEIELLIDNTTPQVRQGNLARVQFATDDRSRVVAIPTEAIVQRGDEVFVYVVNDNQDAVSLRTVEVGIRRDGYAEIISGIERGETVAASNLDALDDNTPVRIVGTFRRHGFRN